MNQDLRSSSAPDRTGSAIDVVLCVAAALSLYAVEFGLDRAGWYPLPSFFKGAPTLVASLFVVMGLQRRHGSSWAGLGLRRPAHWWSIPAWGVLVLIVTTIGQLTIVPVLGTLLGAPPPDFSRYDPLVGNLPLFLVAVLGAMFTGGFIEEVIYRGFLIHRLERILGQGRPAAVGAAVLSGVIFGLIHFEWGFGGMVSTAVMGTLLCFMFLATRRNLWPLVAAHALLDLILLSQVYTGTLAS